MTTGIRRPTDPRRAYNHQAYDVTFGGMPSDGGPAGLGKALSATYAADFEIVCKGDGATTAFTFSIPPMLYGNSLSVLKPHSTALSTAAIALNAIAGGPGAVTIAAALDVTAVAVGTAFDNDVEPDDSYLNWRTVTVTFSAAIPADEVVAIALHMHIMKSAWQ